MDSLHSFWIWWASTLALVAWQLARAWSRPQLSLGYPVIAGLMWSYFYVVLPYQLVRNQPGAVESHILTLAQFQACLAYASLLLGWRYGLHRTMTMGGGERGGHGRSNRRLALAKRHSDSPPEVEPGWSVPTPPEVFDYSTLWNCGLVLMAVGLIGDYTFAASRQAFEGASAYWYLLFNVSYPGLSLCVAVLVLSPRHRWTGNLVLVCALAGPLVWKFLAGARRGPTFVAIVAVSFTYFLVRSRFPKPVQVFGVLGVAGTVLFIQVASRTVVYDEGGTWKQASRQITLKDALVERTTKTGDNEFFNHCLLLEANLRTGRYQYGTTHLAMLVHWIPRAWWAGKPQRNQGFFPSAIPQVSTDSHSNLGVGGAWGSVADTFDNYGWFFPGFWAGIGWFFAWVYRRGVLANNLRWKLHYVGIICASHWFIAQCLPEALVPGLFYQAAYYGAFRLARVPAPRRRRHAAGPEADSSLKPAIPVS